MATAIRQPPATTAKASIYLSYEALALSPKAHGPKGQYQAPKDIIISPRLNYQGLLPLLLESLHLQSHAMTGMAWPSLLVPTVPRLLC